MGSGLRRNDEVVGHKGTLFVIPAKAGTHPNDPPLRLAAGIVGFTNTVLF
jgi:hypothetical protein